MFHLSEVDKTYGLTYLLFQRGGNDNFGLMWKKTRFGLALTYLNCPLGVSWPHRCVGHLVPAEFSPPGQKKTNEISAGQDFLFIKSCKVSVLENAGRRLRVLALQNNCSEKCTWRGQCCAMLNITYEECREHKCFCTMRNNEEWREQECFCAMRNNEECREQECFCAMRNNEECREQECFCAMRNNEECRERHCFCALRNNKECGKQECYAMLSISYEECRERQCFCAMRNNEECREQECFYAMQNNKECREQECLLCNAKWRKVQGTRVFCAMWNNEECREQDCFCAMRNNEECREQ
jgi:hypothetical protein